MSLKGLANLGEEVNPRCLGEWPTKIGSLILNFAAIELISYRYLVTLESTENDFRKNIDKLLSERIKRICELIKGSSKIQGQNKKKVISLWNQVKKFSKLRNRIAHNPVHLTWKVGSDSEKDPPDLICIPDMKQIKKSSVSDTISLKGMNKLIDDTIGIALRLQSEFKYIKK